MSDNKLQVQEVKRTLNRINAKKLHVAYHFLQIVESPEGPENYRKLKVQKKNPKKKKKKEKTKYIIKNKDKIASDFYSEIFQSGGTSEIFKVLREKKTNKSIL